MRCSSPVCYLSTCYAHLITFSFFFFFHSRDRLPESYSSGTFYHHIATTFKWAEVLQPESYVLHSTEMHGVDVTTDVHVIAPFAENDGTGTTIMVSISKHCCRHWSLHQHGSLKPGTLVSVRSLHINTQLNLKNAMTPIL